MTYIEQPIKLYIKHKNSLKNTTPEMKYYNLRFRNQSVVLVPNHLLTTLINRKNTKPGTT